MCSPVVRSGVFLQARAVCITAVLYVKVHSNDITFRFDLECGLAGGTCVCFVGAKDRAYRFWNVGCLFVGIIASILRKSCVLVGGADGYVGQVGVLVAEVWHTVAHSGT